MSTSINPRPLNKDVFLIKGSQDTDSSNIRNHAQDPSHIFIFGWMDASMNLMSKYARGHRELYPTSDIIIVQSHSSFMYTSPVERERTLEPAVEILISSLSKQDTSKGLLFHVISNGGGFQLMTLANILQARLSRLDKNKNESSSPRINHSFPIALIFDSVPGANEYSSMLATFTASLQSPFAKKIATLPITLLYCVFYIINYGVLRNDHLLPLLHEHLAKPNVLPWSNKHTPRIYVYSDADTMVPFSAVEDHIRLVRELGYSVAQERFQGTPHVSHMRSDPERYWSAVQVLWKDAVRVYSIDSKINAKL